MRKLFLVGSLLGLGVLAASCFVASSRVYQSGNNFVFVGEARNATNADVVQSYVKVQYLDSLGNVLATDFVAPCTRTLQAGASAPVTDTLVDGGLSVASVQTTVQWVTAGHRDPAALAFSNLDVSQSGTTLFAAGTVTNTGADSYAGVHVCMAAYDVNGVVVGVADGYLANPTIGAGASSTFDFTGSMPSGVPASTYKLWVDAWDATTAMETAPVMTTAAAVPTATPTSTPVTPTNTPTVTPVPTNTPTVTPTP